VSSGTRRASFSRWNSGHMFQSTSATCSRLPAAHWYTACSSPRCSSSARISCTACWRPRSRPAMRSLMATAPAQPQTRDRLAHRAQGHPERGRGTVEAARGMRNLASHPERQGATAPGTVLRTLTQAAHDINRCLRTRSVEGRLQDRKARNGVPNTVARSLPTHPHDRFLPARGPSPANASVE
jgi:hypothetical protein